jgi:hypothetical protein
MVPCKHALAMVSLLLVARAAQADQVDADEEVAKTACLAGDFGKGVAILSKLYVSTRDPVFIFNQGRCFEQNHRYEDAISRFQEYLRVGKRLSQTDKADARKHIADCRQLLTEQRAASPGPESVEPKSAKEAKERAARKACLTGDPATGVGILADLFIDTQETTYLFNQGRCFEQNRRYEDAIGRFREYLMKAKDLSPEAKADTEKHIAACASYLSDKPGEPGQSKASTDQVEKDRPEKGRIEKDHVDEPPGRTASLVVAPAEPKPSRPGAVPRVAGLALAGVGVVGLVTGLVLNLKVNSMASDLENEYDPDSESTRKTYATIGWVGYGAGAACLIGGTVLYYLGWSRAKAPSSLAVIPAVGPDMAGTALWGRF